MRYILSLILVVAIAVTNAGTEIRLSGIQSIEDFAQACFDPDNHIWRFSTSPYWVPLCMLQNDKGEPVILFLDNIDSIRFEEDS